MATLPDDPGPDPNARFGAVGLTFDDVCLVPSASDVVPAAVDTSTVVAGDIRLEVPLVSAAMDTVTESRLAIAMAREGAIGVIHRNLSVEDQRAEVDKVKRSESGMIVDPVTLGPDDLVQAAEDLMAKFRISGVPIVDEDRQLRRHPHQPGPALRDEPRPPDPRGDDLRGPRHHPGGHDPGGGPGDPGTAPDREAAGGRRRGPHHRAHHCQGHQQEDPVPQRHEGRPGAAAVRGGRGGRRRRLRPGRGTGGRRGRRAGRGHGTRPLGRRDRGGPQGQGRARGRRGRRQHRHRRGRPGPARRGGRRGQGGDRAGVDLHHADRRRRRGARS